MMPCWTVQSNSVALKGLDEKLLRATLTAMGYRTNSAEYSAQNGFPGSLTADRFSDRTSIVLRPDGTLTVNLGAGSSADLATVTNELKRTYAAETIKAAAKQFGWNVKQTATNKFAVQRRY